jgi:hypothetical protein
MVSVRRAASLSRVNARGRAARGGVPQLGPTRELRNGLSRFMNGSHAVHRLGFNCSLHAAMRPSLAAPAIATALARDAPSAAHPQPVAARPRLAAAPSGAATVPVLDAAGRPRWVGVPGRAELGQVVLHHDASGRYHAHTGGPRSHDYPLKTSDPGTAIARIRDWLRQSPPPMQGIYGRSATAEIETALRAFGADPSKLGQQLAAGIERSARSAEKTLGVTIGPVTAGHAAASSVAARLEATVLPRYAQHGAPLRRLADLFGSHRYYMNDALLDHLDRAARDASSQARTLGNVLDAVVPGGSAKLQQLRLHRASNEQLQARLGPRFEALFRALEAWSARPADSAVRRHVNDAVAEIEAATAPAGARQQLSPAQRDGLARARVALARPAPRTSAAPRSTATAPRSPLDASGGWIYENLKLPNQHIYELWDGPHDYTVRIVMDQQAVAVQPASLSLKATIADVGTRRADVKLGKLTVRHESSALKHSTGTKLQFGYDVTRASEAKRREYSAAGEPVMDLISIETKAEGVADRWRAELALERGQRPDVKVMVQQAASLGGYLRWRRVWEDPKSGVKSGIDVILGMKSEGSIEAGPGAATGGIDAKADIEATVRYFGPAADTVDIHHLEAQASQVVAQLLWPESAPKVALEPRNHGHPALARQRVTAQLMFGASVWQMAPQSVSGGKNHGHHALDLALRTNQLLHAEGALPAQQSLRSTVEATQRLRALWRESTAGQRAAWARQLANPLGINFGLVELEAANAALVRSRDPSPQFEKHRKLFLDLY